MIRLGVGGFLAMNIMTFSLLLYSGAFSGEDAWLVTPVHWLLLLLATPLLVTLGGPFFRDAWQALRQGRLSTDTLVAIGALAAYAYSAVQVLRGSDLVYFDTVTMVLLLFTLGRYLEAQGRARAARSLAPMLAAERAEARVSATPSKRYTRWRCRPGTWPACCRANVSRSMAWWSKAAPNATNPSSPASRRPGPRRPAALCMRAA